MRNLKYAILGLLNQEDLTGYEIMQKFDGALSEFWYANHSQIYPELKKLSEEKMVEYHIEISGNILEKKVYSITREGKEDFEKWMRQNEKIQPTPKDIFKLKLFFSNELSLDEQKTLIQNELEKHQKRLEQLQENERNFNGIPDKNTDRYYDYLVLMGAIMREETHCEWLSKCLQMI